MTMPGYERIRSGAAVLAAVGVAIALLVLAMTVGRVSARGRIQPRSVASHVEALDVLRADGIGRARFGASPTALRQAIDALVGQRGGAYARGGSCGLDHEITWWDQPTASAEPRTASGEPALIAYFRRSEFAGYQFGDPDLVAAPGRPPGGWTLATTRGLRVADTLAHGQHVYGRAFTISTAQGGSWSLHASSGRLEGYAWGRPKHGDVSWQSVVSTIDAGDVGCAAATP
jgi:hypothetical protein